MNSVALHIRSKRSCILKIMALIMLFFGVNLYLAFATDTYATFASGFDAAALDMTMRNGRLIICSE